MNTLIPSNGGYNEINGLPIQYSPIVIFNYYTLQILKITDTYSSADEISCDYWHKGVDARVVMLKFWDDNLNSKKIIGMNLSQFEDFVNNNNHPLLNINEEETVFNVEIDNLIYEFNSLLRRDDWKSKSVQARRNELEKQISKSIKEFNNQEVEEEDELQISTEEIAAKIRVKFAHKLKK